MHLLVLCFLGDPMLPGASVPNSGGFNIDILELMEFLSTTTWRCSVITNDSIYMQKKMQKYNERITIYRIHVNPEHLNNQDDLSSEYQVILEQTRNLCFELPEKAHLIHSYYWFSGKIAADLSKELRIPFVHSPVSLSMDKILAHIKPRATVQTAWEKEFLPEAKIIMTITQSERELLLNQYNIPPETIITVGRGVKEVFRKPIRDFDGIPRGLVEQVPEYNHLTSQWWCSGAFLYVGRLQVIKGVPEVVQAWYLLYGKYGTYTPPLWLVGGSPSDIQMMRTYIMKSIPNLQEMESEHKIVWWGYLNADGIATLYLKVLVFVSHSKFEAGGRTIIEALSAGKPVIATPNGFAADYIHRWESGFLVPFGAIRELARRMEHFIKQPLLGLILGNNARLLYHYMENEWSCYEKHLNIYEAIYRYIPYINRDIKTHTPKYQSISSAILADSAFTDYQFLKSQVVEFLVENGINYSKIIKESDFIWVAIHNSKTLRIERYFSRMNLVCLLGLRDSYASLADEQYTRALRCSHVYPGCSTIMASCDINHFIAWVEPNELQHPNSLALIKHISVTRENQALPLGEVSECISITTLWKAMATEAEDAFSTWGELWRNTFSEKQMPVGPDTVVLCYGKSFVKNAFLLDQRICIRPSSDAFVGTQGIDIATCLIELCLDNFSKDTLYEYINLASNFSGLGVDYISQCCQCLVSLIYMKQTLLDEDEIPNLRTLAICLGFNF